MDGSIEVCPDCGEEGVSDEDWFAGLHDCHPAEDLVGRVVRLERTCANLRDDAVKTEQMRDALRAKVTRLREALAAVLVEVSVPPEGQCEYYWPGDGEFCGCSVAPGSNYSCERHKTVPIGMHNRAVKLREAVALAKEDNL